MDFKHSIDYRTEKYSKYNKLGNLEYDYESNGILTKCLPKILFKGNVILTSFLQLIDIKLIMLFKQIDKIKRFKYITWY